MKYYFLMIIGDMCALLALWFIYLNTYKPKRFEAFCDIAVYGHQNPPTPYKFKHP